MEKEVKNISILGSTGSIGTQTLDIVSEFPHRFKLRTLTARRNWQLLARQATEYLPERVVIADDEAYPMLKSELSPLPIRVESGAEAIADAMEDENLDMVVTAMVGYSGLAPTIRAVKRGKTIALANKETLVAGGSIVTRLARENGATIIPVDSEHSAIFQCLRGERTAEAEKIILTASGGPFRTFSKEELENVTVAQALAHPNWSMGAKVTVDSASMMNKGFEMIEAHWLFGCPVEQIEVVVHPQSIVHSMVQFADGSVKAQLGVPDMHIPIMYALGYPNRLASTARHLSLSQYRTLTFEAPDMEKFPLLALAFDAIAIGGNMPCALNAANEVGVAGFIAGKLRFTDMPRVAEAVMSRVAFIATPGYEDIVATDTICRRMASEFVEKEL